MPGRRAGDPAGDPRLPGFIKRLNLLLASNLEPQAILAGIVEDVVAMLGAADGCIRLMGPEDRVGHTMVRRAAQSGSWPREVAISVMGFLADGHAHLATSDLLEDRRFSGLRAVETRVRAVLAVPLTVSQQLIGVLAVSDPRPGRRWSDEQVQLLSMAANYSADGPALGPGGGRAPPGRRRAGGRHHPDGAGPRGSLTRRNVAGRRGGVIGGGGSAGVRDLREVRAIPRVREHCHAAFRSAYSVRASRTTRRAIGGVS
jgi:hypothetical protein